MCGSTLGPLALAPDTLTHITGNCTLLSSHLGRACWLRGCCHQVLRLGRQAGTHPRQRAPCSLIYRACLALSTEVSSEPRAHSGGPPPSLCLGQGRGYDCSGPCRLLPVKELRVCQPHPDPQGSSWLLPWGLQTGRKGGDSWRMWLGGIGKI